MSIKSLELSIINFCEHSKSGIFELLPFIMEMYKCANDMPTSYKIVHFEVYKKLARFVHLAKMNAEWFRKQFNNWFNEMNGKLNELSVDEPSMESNEEYNELFNYFIDCGLKAARTRIFMHSMHEFKTQQDRKNIKSTLENISLVRLNVESILCSGMFYECERNAFQSLYDDIVDFQSSIISSDEEKYNNYFDQFVELANDIEELI